jgi:hypothetical protein
MKRLSTILLLLCIAHNLSAQRKSKNAPQSFMAIETGVPIFFRPSKNFPIPLNIEWQRKNNKWSFGASIALQYDRYSWGDCSRRYPFNTITGRDVTAFVDFYRPYCETFQYLDFKPSIFGIYYFLQKKKFNLFAKLGSIGNIPIIANKEGEYYEIESQNTTTKVKDPGPIHISRNIRTYQTTQIGLLSGVGVNYFFNKRTALRFTFQSEFYSSNYWYERGSSIFALGGINFKI